MVKNGYLIAFLTNFRFYVNGEIDVEDEYFLDLLNNFIMKMFGADPELMSKIFNITKEEDKKDKEDKEDKKDKEDKEDKDYKYIINLSRREIVRANRTYIDFPEKLSQIYDSLSEEECIKISSLVETFVSYLDEIYDISTPRIRS